jgi:hypothetical protein
MRALFLLAVVSFATLGLVSYAMSSMAPSTAQGFVAMTKILGSQH